MKPNPKGEKAILGLLTVSRRGGGEEGAGSAGPSVSHPGPGSVTTFPQVPPYKPGGPASAPGRPICAALRGDLVAPRPPSFPTSTPPLAPAPPTPRSRTPRNRSPRAAGLSPSPLSGAAASTGRSGREAPAPAHHGHLFRGRPHTSGATPGAGGQLAEGSGWGAWAQGTRGRRAPGVAGRVGTQGGARRTGTGVRGAQGARGKGVPIPAGVVLA